MMGGFSEKEKLPPVEETLPSPHRSNQSLDSN